MEHWYLATHKSGKKNAFKAQLFLSQVGVTTFIPQVCISQSRSDRPGKYRKCIEALFPGYIFVFFDYEKLQIAKVENCPGMNGMVRFGGLLKPLSESVVDEIMNLTSIITEQNVPHDTGQSKIFRPGSRTSLTREQHQKIADIAKEVDGQHRNTLFYAFLDAMKKP